MNISKTISTIIVVSMVASFGFSQKGRSGGSKSSSSTFPSLGKSGSIFGGKLGGDVSVKGYTKKDGTYVAPHMRSSKDGFFDNNWTTKGNYNPYTLKEGTKTSPNFTGGYYQGYNFNTYSNSVNSSTTQILGGAIKDESNLPKVLKGLSKDEITKIFGKPNSISKKYLEYWKYNDEKDDIIFDDEGVWFAFDCTGKLQKTWLAYSQKNENNGAFKNFAINSSLIGLSREQIKKLLGKPFSTEFYETSKNEYWLFDNGTTTPDYVMFNGEKVGTVGDYSGQLQKVNSNSSENFTKLSEEKPSLEDLLRLINTLNKKIEQLEKLLGEKKNISNESTEEYFSLGSSKEEVLRIMGRPDRQYSLTSSEVLCYGDDYVQIWNEDKKVFAYKNNSGKLKIK